MKTKLFLTMMVVNLLTIGLLQAQNISLYCVGNDTTGGTNKLTFYQVDAFSSTANAINPLTEIEGKITGSSSFDNDNDYYLFSGIDTNQIKRLYTVDTLGNILYNPAMSNLEVSALQYDFKTHNTYGFVYDTSTCTRHLGIINTNDANISMFNE
ncbi:MAG: hypothetical protein J7L46_06095 [Bacteroidales bacterium]|nr:hypothetical protein [Bacteroidales bacterium]